MEQVEKFKNKRVSVITDDGRHIVGLMIGFDGVDQANLVLENPHERVYK